MSGEFYMRFRRKGMTLIRPVQAGEPFTGIHGITMKDDKLVCEGDKKPVAYVCMDPENTIDKWTISQEYLDKYFEIDA